MTSSQPVQPGAQGSVAIVGNHYQVGKKIGEGSFGVVFEGTNLLNGHIVAIKFEPRKSDAPQLRDEYRSYRILQGCSGIPQAYYYGTEGLHNVLCIDLLGPNLEDLRSLFADPAPQIERVQCIHEKNLIYRSASDPQLPLPRLTCTRTDNFLIGLPGTDKSDMIYMVDFGMAKLWRDPRTRQHIPYRERKSLSGTARYMSVNTHLGREQSRRDDLEGLGHVFMYFLRGSLPWQGLKAANNKQKYERIGEKKQSVPIADLCDGYPEEFAIYLNYVRKLGFEETPDYEFLRELFAKVLRAAGEVDDSMFDWKLLNNKQGWQASSKLPSSLVPPLQHSIVHRTRDGATNTRQRSSGMQAANGTNAAMTPPSPAAINRHVSKQRKHNSAGPTAGNVPGTPGSTGLLVGSARASRAISPLQTQTQPSGAVGNPLLLTSSTGGQPATGTPHQPHPYAAATGMQSYGGRQGGPNAPERDQSFGPSTPVQGLNAFGTTPGARNSGGLVPVQSNMNNAGPRMGGANGPYTSTAQMNGNLPNGGQERDLPAPPRRNAFLDILRCRCG
ncbi:kinase-like domain-containing protein [Cantharellus anzutake]|uniref:kinase-like domain-containing protein n=1 Tax=Cantharellus anzutake TaxID=1750568 RepID=UPI001907185D|nr:kinase-like domain-containing protein [Cantharellus anzutake]KAF8339918.1 kinase-like domain-containing protein [Cantharellus anzutake]